MSAANIDRDGYAHLDCQKCGRHEHTKAPWRACTLCYGRLVDTPAEQMSRYVGADGRMRRVAFGDFLVAPYYLANLRVFAQQHGWDADTFAEYAIVNGWDERPAGAAFAVALRHQAAGTRQSVSAAYEEEDAAHAEFDAWDRAQGLPPFIPSLLKQMNAVAVPRPPKDAA